MEHVRYSRIANDSQSIARRLWADNTRSTAPRTPAAPSLAGTARFAIEGMHRRPTAPRSNGAWIPSNGFHELEIASHPHQPICSATKTYASRVGARYLALLRSLRNVPPFFPPLAALPAPTRRFTDGGGTSRISTDAGIPSPCSNRRIIGSVSER